MKKRCFFIKIMLTMIVGGLWFPQQLFAQATDSSLGAVLHLSKNEFNNYFNTGVDFNALLNAGQVNEASFEFWIKAQNDHNDWVLTDVLSDQESFSMRMENNHQLKVKVKGVEKLIDLNGQVGKETWHHIALVANNGTTILYVNGRTRGVFTDLDFNATLGRQLYFYKAKETELFVTEVRAWNQARTKQDILRYWTKVIDSNKADELALHINKGLDVLLNRQKKFFPSFGILGWSNAIESSEVKGGQGVSHAVRGITFMDLKTKVGHPILELEEILVTASKGEFSDKVQLKWNHIAKATRYTVSRRPQTGASFVTLPNAPTINTQQAGDELVFEDKDLTAGERYVYKVQALGNDSFTTSGQTLGFIFYNGQISGKVATNRQDPVQDVEITATLKDGGLPGHTLMFDASTPAIEVDNIEALRNQPRFTMGFWYKGTGSNTVFAMGDSKIQLANNKLIVTNADGSTYVEGNLGVHDNQWHHYAFTFAPVLNEEQKPIGAEGKLYQDGEEIAMTSTPYQAPPGSVNRFLIGAQNNAAYQLDEFKVWKVAKDAKQLKQTYRHVLSGEEENLLLYYRFDEGNGKEVYNYALANRNEYIGKSQAKGQDLRWSTDQHAGLYYGTLTSTSGAYVLKGLNYGTGSTGKAFNVVPKKPNHEFKAPTIEVLLQRGQNISKSDVDFTDISQFTISGRIVYKEGDEVYPVPQGQQITLDNGTAKILGTGDKAKSDATGLFTTSASPELLTIAVNSIATKRSNLVNQSLRFDGKTAYAQSEGTITHSGNATWSFWVKPASATEVFEGEVTPDASTQETSDLPLVQTVFQLGNIQLDLEDGETLVLKKDGADLIRSTQAISNQTMSFCAVSYEAATQKFTLYVGETPDVSNSATGVDMTGHFTLGAAWVNNAIATPFRGHLDHVEFRTSIFTHNEFKSIKDGEFIANDAQHLQLSYPMVASGGNRELSLTAQAKHQGLRLEGVARDNKVVSINQGSYKYSYVASNPRYNPKGEAYELNLTGVTTELDFENTTRYGFVGNLIVPCDNSIGNLKGRIFRTDIQGYERSFNADNFNGNVLMVEDLLPGKYRVEIFRENASADAEPLLRSPVLDITQGWASYDFEYHNPLQVDYKIYAVEVKTNIDEGKPEVEGVRGQEIQPLCTGKYSLKAYTNYELEVTVSEEFQNGKCNVSGIDYTISGSLGTPAKGQETGKTNENGKAIIRFMSAGPSFDAADYLEQFQISVRTKNRDTEDFLKSFITGSQMLSNDFTLTEPQVMYVLHDPPGDGSFAKLDAGATISFTSQYTTDIGVETSTEFSTGADVQTTFGAGFGVFVLNRLFENQSSAGIKIDATNLNTIDHSTLWTLTLNESYSTPAGGKVVGPEADLLIGAARVITRGKSRKLEVTGCTAQVVEDPNATALSYTSSFATKVADVRETTLPGLKSLIEELSAKSSRSAKENKLLDSARTSKVAWENILKKNEEKIAKADTYEKLRHGYSAGANRLDYEKGDFVFSGGGSSYTVALDWSREYSTTNSHAFNGKIGTPINNELNIAGVEVKVKTQINAVWNNKFSFKNTENKKTGISFTLTDDDQGDQFHVFMRRDPDYDTPIFKTNAGRSSCPYERGTQHREGARIEVLNGATQVTPAGTQAIYRVRLTNTQVADDNKGKSYNLSTSGATTRSAKISINGNSPGTPASFFLMPSQSVEALVVVEQNAVGDTDYENISLLFSSGCEATLGTAAYSNRELYERKDDGTIRKDANDNPIAKGKVRDNVLLNAYFRTPCVSSFDIKRPTANWVVNNTSNDHLSLRFKPEQPQDDFKKVEVEYATEGNNKALLLTTLNVADLTKDSEEYYTASLDVSSLVDGKYSIRLVPVCGEAGTNRNNVSEWIEGTIQRNAPVIASVTPVDNGIIGSDGVISATYTDKISNDGVNSLNINVMGVLANSSYEATAARFTEATDHIQIPDNDVLDMESYTVEFWVKPLQTNVTVPIIEKGNNFQVSLMPDGKINAQRVRSDQPLTPNQWSHVAVSYDKANKNMQIYVNGRLAGERDLKLVSEPFGTNDQPVTIAKAVNGQGFKGSLDEVRIWNKARTSSQIIDNQRTMLLGNEENLAGYYRLDNNALTVDGVKEGIRDFTGNASGTTAEGIAWVTKQEAAPLQVEAVPQSIPVTIRRSNENQILITPDLADSDLEGAYLTINIANNKIKDLLGNQIEGKVWSFRYEKNHIAWNQRSIDLQQVWQQEKNFALTLMNSGATGVTYQLTDLPKWIKPSGKVTEQGYTLNSGQNESIDFILQPWLNAGEHTGTIKAKTFDSNGRLLGTEQVVVNVHVSCSAPIYALNTAQFRHTMFLNSSLHINGERSIDERDRVTAFVIGNNGQTEVRGTGQVHKQGNQYTVSMLIYSSQAQGEPLQFRVWDASECREYGNVIESYTFGDTNTPTLTVGNTLVRKLSVVAGFQYVTFNATNSGHNYLSIAQVKGLPAGSKIYAQDGTETSYDGENWSGNLTKLFPTKAYQIESPAAAQVELQGQAVALNTDIQINPGIQWIGYLSDQTSPIEKALSGLNLSDYSGLRLIGQGSFSTYNPQNNQWEGTLEYLTPNMGYQLVALGSGTLNYATGFGAASRELSSRATQRLANKPMYEIRTEAKALGMQVNVLKYRYAAHVIGAVTNDGQRVDAADYIVTAHNKAGKVRGVAVPQMVNGKLMYFLTVHANDKQAAYEVRLTHRTTKAVQKLDVLLHYTNQIQGSLKTPYEFRINQANSQTKEAKAALFSGYKLYQNQPNPFHDVTSISYELPQADKVYLAVYNTQGQEVAVLAKGDKAAGKHTVQWKRNGLPSGVYFYALTTKAGKLMTKRLIIH